VTHGSVGKQPGHTILMRQRHQLRALAERLSGLQAVLVDGSGPITVVAEPGEIADAGRARTEIPPAVTPIRAGGPSRGGSRPTTPKSPGKIHGPTQIR